MNATETYTSLSHLTGASEQSSPPFARRIVLLNDTASAFYSSLFPRRIVLYNCTAPASYSIILWQ